jgi:hypothetical protein
MSTCRAPREELEEGREIFIGGEVGPTRIADERVAHDCRPVINGQFCRGIDEELFPERTKGLWDLRNTGKTIRPQRRDRLADPCANAITRDCDTSAGTEEMLAGKLVIGASCGQVGDELITTCKQVAK